MHFTEIRNAQEATVARKTGRNFEQDQVHVGCDAADVKTELLYRSAHGEESARSVPLR